MPWMPWSILWSNELWFWRCTNVVACNVASSRGSFGDVHTWPQEQSSLYFCGMFSFNNGRVVSKNRSWPLIASNKQLPSITEYRGFVCKWINFLAKEEAYRVNLHISTQKGRFLSRKCIRPFPVRPDHSRGDSSHRSILFMRNNRWTEHPVTKWVTCHCYSGFGDGTDLMMSFRWGFI